MNSFNFLQKFLLIVSCIMVLMGIFIALFNHSTMFNYLFNNQIDPVFGINNLSPDDILRFQSWIYGVLGATLSGWGVFLAFIFYYPFREKQKWSWNCIAAGVSLWFLLDTTISINFHVYFNAVFNAILFLSLIVPIILVKKYF
jgi:hypothetical protein